MLFSELNLKASSLKAVEALGFETPSEIQEKSIPMLMGEDIDFIGQAQTGTGKTAAFTLPLLEKLDLSARHIQAVIIAPTRELANQICEEVKKLSKFEPVGTLAVYGGVSIQNQLRDLKKNKPQIIVGTPGRMLDVIGRGAFDLEKCKYVVLDEADEMLDMGFFDDVQEILAEVPSKKIWMFSATMPKPILNMINKHFCNPELVRVTKKILTNDMIDQQFCIVSRRDQTEALCRYLDFYENTYALVFARTRVGVKELTDELNNRGFTADALHGDMSQDARDMTMRKFKQKRISLLVCTDVAARGIDVSDLTHVINFGLPQDNESYVHRIGRTGRGGSKGIALSIIEPSEVRRVGQIERITKAKIEKVELPKVEAIVEILTTKAFDKFATSITEFSEEGDSFDKFKTRFEETSKEDVMKGLYSFIFEQSLGRYKKARNVDVDLTARRERSDRGERGERSTSGSGAQSGYERYHITIGRVKGLEPGGLIKFVANSLDLKGSEVGKISILDDFSFFELPDTYSDKVLSLGKQTYEGESFSIQVAKARENRPSRSRTGGGGSRSGGGANRGGDRSGTSGASANRGGDRAGSGYRSRSREGSSTSAPREGNSSAGASRDGNRSYSRPSERDGNRTSEPRKSFRR
jgi:ATP-dependent RNA helicase DeaD